MAEILEDPEDLIEAQDLIEAEGLDINTREQYEKLLIRPQDGDPTLFQNIEHTLDYFPGEF